MGTKNYLSPEEQWDRTVALGLNCGFSNDGSDYEGLKRSWHLGRIVQPHRLFRAGDFVIVRISNGMAVRQPVWAVSSKGHTVTGFYLNYAKFSPRRPKGGKFYWIRVKSKESGQIVTQRVKKKCRRSLHNGDFFNGPLRFVDIPEHLVGLQPDAPPCRQFIVALAREGWRRPDKRE